MLDDMLDGRKAALKFVAGLLKNYTDIVDPSCYIPVAFAYVSVLCKLF